MTRKKNGFLTFIFSLLPGAGEMYMGFFKQGMSIMAIFFLLFSISSWLELGALIFVIPVLWFYSFFHVHNLASLSDEEFYAIEDKYIFEMDNENTRKLVGGDKGRKVLAGILILVGGIAIWNMFVDFMDGIIAISGLNFSWAIEIADSVPRLVFSVAIIVVGVLLIRGKKKELDQMDKKENTDGDQER